MTHDKESTATLASLRYLPAPSRAVRWIFCAMWLGLGFASLLGGPALGDHEVIVAQTARQILESGEWMVLHYLDTPFLMKPPLAPWLVAAASSILPVDAATNLPVSALTARLPSLLATLLTVFVVYRLGVSMYGRRVGALCGFVFATAFGTLLFSCNATAEALLTFFCTWSFGEFWWAMRSQERRQRRIHLARFYIALGLAMLAKGPIPLAVVCIPLATWWLLHRPGELLVRGGRRGIARGFRKFFVDLLPRLSAALESLGLWWGVPLFLLMFVPWLFLVGRRVPYFWDLMNYEYLDRLEGQYPGAKSSNFFYYLPIMLGLALPWSLSVPEALIAPLLRRYRSSHRAMALCWYWVVVSLAILSAMSFKKSYYILPALPGVALLLGPVIENLFFVAEIQVLRARRAIIAALGIFVLIAIVCWLLGGRMYPEEWTPAVAVFSAAAGIVMLAVFGLAGALFLTNRRPVALIVIGHAGLFSFVGAWHWIGPSAANIEDPMQVVQGLNDAGVPAEAEIYWAGNRPDGRVLFYGRRRIRQIVDPYKLIVDRSEHGGEKSALREFVGRKLCDLLESPSPVYCVLEREDFIILKKLLGAPAEELFHVDRGHIGIEKNDWVISTNHAGMAVARKPAPSSGPGR